MNNLSLNFNKWMPWCIILLASLLPLFFEYPFRFNVFLAWDGAYRLSIGHLPYKDFGLPLGVGFWLLPAIIFKLFGANIFNLIITQALINLVASYTFYKIATLVQVRAWVANSALLIFAMSYTMANPWPWYNHTVFVLQLLGIYFLLKVVLQNKNSMLNLSLSAFFVVWSIFTKQDGGALALGINIVLMFYFMLTAKKYKLFLAYICFVLFFILLFVLPFYNSGIGYWFNYGQSPHFSRITIMDILNEIFGASQWLKFYLLLVAIAIWIGIDTHGFRNHSFNILALLVLGILFQASLIQVTSYTPINGNIYFHAFAFLFIAQYLVPSEKFDPSLWFQLLSLSLVGFIWTGEFWNRQIRFRIEQYFSTDSYDPQKVVSKNTFILDKSAKPNTRANWEISKLETFYKIKLPHETIQGIDSIMKMPEVQKKCFKILNMSELTMLAKILNYEPEKGKPLWYHQNVSIFDKEIEAYVQDIKNQKYDLVMFQIIPDLNNFYPPLIRETLIKEYQKSFQFLAPRVDENSTIEVYVKKKIKR